MEKNSLWNINSKIYGLVEDDKIIARGIKLSNANRVQNLTENYDEYGRRVSINAMVIGDTANYNTQIFFEGNDVKDFSCDCKYFELYGTPCKHIVALSLMYAKYKSFTEFKEVRSVEKSEIFSAYNRLVQSEIATLATPDVVIEPYIINDFGQLFVRFRIGRDKTYIIKDIPEFVRKFETAASYKYGEKFIFNHCEAYLTESSVAFLRVMRNAVELLIEANSYSSYGRPKTEKLVLCGEIADEVYNYGLHNAVEIKDDGRRDSCGDEERLRIEISLRKVGKEVYSLRAVSPFYAIAGSKNYYIIGEDNIHKCNLSAYRAIQPLASELSEGNGYSFTMSEAHLKEWVRNIVPIIEKYFDVNYFDVNIEQYKAMPLLAECYFDVPDGDIECVLKCKYGEKEVDIYSISHLRSGIGTAYEEMKLKSVIDKYFVYDNGTHLIINEDKQYEFLTVGIAEIEKICAIFCSERFKNLSFRRKPTVNVGIKLDGELLDVNVTFDGEYSSEEIIRILEACKVKKKYIKLSANKFVDLIGANYDIVDELSEISGASVSKIVDGDVNVRKYRALHLDKIIAQSDAAYVRNAGFRELIKSIKNYEDTDYEVDTELAVKLRHYQTVGFSWFKSLSYYGFGGILADDMGLGKSVQTIAFLQSLKGVSIVVCPASLILNWKSEFEKFAPRIRAAYVYGTKTERENIIDNMVDYDVIVTSYELLRKDIGKYENFMFEAAILDEGQYIKNHITMNSRSVKMIRSKYKFALTGTPIENNIAELWSIFDFIMPDYLYNYNKFKRTFENSIVKENDPQATERLKQMVAPFVLRRLKKDVLKELPDKIDNLISVPLENEQRALYAANLAVIKGEINEIKDYSKGKFMVLSYLTKLRQICCSPSLVAENYVGNNAKMDECLDLIATSVANGHKVLLFSQFTSILAIIRKRLEEMDITYYLLQGDTKIEARMQMVNDFNSDDTSVFLLSLKAGGTGLNLTAADIVIHYDPWWNLSVQNQATDRAHRIGQNKSVQVYRLILKDTIEEKIIQLQSRKQELFDSIIKEGEVDFGKMSKEQLLDLLEN